MFMRSAVCFYHLATGKPPLQAVRACCPTRCKPSIRLRVTSFQLAFRRLFRAMAVHIDSRYQTVTAFREALGWNVGLQPRVVTLPNPQVWLEPDTAPRTGPKPTAAARWHRAGGAR